MTSMAQQEAEYGARLIIGNRFYSTRRILMRFESRVPVKTSALPPEAPD
jgi:hypothetical protein